MITYLIRKIPFRIISILIGGCLLASCTFSSRTFPTEPEIEDNVISIEVMNNPSQVDYYEGDYFDPSGMVVKATWSSGKIEENIVNNRQFHYDDAPLTINDNNIELSYHGISTYLNISVIQDTLLNLEIKNYPLRNIYFLENDKIDLNGLTLSATFKSGRIKEISSGEVTSNTSITSSTTAINVSYLNKEINIPISVINGTNHINEGESFIINGGSKVFKCTSDELKETYAHPSGDAFIQMKNTSGSGFSFIFNSNKNTIARFIFKMFGNNKDFIFGNTHNISLNTDKIISNTNILDNSNSWNDYVVFTTNIYEGTNRLSVLNKGGTTANIDSVNVYTDANIEIPAAAIIAGTSAYSIDTWNEIFPNQNAEVTSIGEDKYLDITLLDGKKTIVTASDGQSDLDGILDLSAFKKVTIKGNGTFEVKYNELCDGINAYNLTIEEGVTLNLIGFTKEDKSGIKIYEELIINGTLNISGFSYAHAITKDQSSQIRIYINEGGKYNISDVKYGIYAWSTVILNPLIEVKGNLNISSTNSAITLLKASDLIISEYSNVNIVSTEGYGIYNNSGSIILKDHSNVSIESGNSAIYNCKNLIIANGNDFDLQNAASLSVVSNENVIYSKAANFKVIFNTTGELLIKSTQNKTKTGIQFADKSASGLIIKASNLTIENALNAFGAWVNLTNASIFTDYDYSSSNTNYINIVNCSNIYNSGYKNDIAFGSFTNDTVNRV